MTGPSRLNERAALGRPSLWHVDDGWALFAGPLQHNDSHAHSTAVFLAGLYGTFRLRVADSPWLSCRSAVIRAGTPYEFDVGGDPLGVFYLEPSVAGADALAPLVAGAHEVNGALVGRCRCPVAALCLRAAFATRPGRFARRGRRCRGPCQAQITTYHRRSHLPLRRGIANGNRCGLGERGRGRRGAIGIALPASVHTRGRRALPPLSGVAPLRAAIREVVGGSSLTAAAHAAGFADQAHFTRSFRRTFGAPPSRGL